MSPLTLLGTNVPAVKSLSVRSTLLLKKGKRIVDFLQCIDT